MILHDESPREDLLRGSLEQALSQPGISPEGPMTVQCSQTVPAQPHRTQCDLAQQLIQADLLSPLSNACLLLP